MNKLFFFSLVIILMVSSCSEKSPLNNKEGRGNDNVTLDSLFAEQVVKKVTESDFNKFVNENTNSELFFDAVNVKDCKNVVFNEYLEKSIPTNKNVIYSATLLFAWEEIVRQIGDSIVNFDNDVLKEFSKSKSYKEVLKPNEYKSFVKVEGTRIIAKSFFNKSLPFNTPLNRDLIPFLFNNSKVQSFSFSGDDNYARVMYYLNEDDFALSISTSDYHHDVILIKSDFNNVSNFSNFVSDLKSQSREFLKKRNRRNHWNYRVNAIDTVRVPEVNFNLISSFDYLDGAKFSTSTKNYIIDTIIQRNAFEFNEKGAEVESKAEIATEEAAEEPSYEQHPLSEKPYSRKFIFDKSFIILLKRNGAKHPYFCGYIYNDELLVKK